MGSRPQVGIVYAPGMDDVLRSIPDAFDVLEIEPQTLSPSLAGHPDAPPPAGADLASIAPFPHPKVVHSVGLPFGNEVAPSPAEVDAVRFAADAVDAPWVSDHLSFNHGGNGFAGFLLPLPQTTEAVHHAADRIEAIAELVQRPVLFETGANYLHPGDDEMSDGAFFAAVAEAADCGILLDLHNLWTNERNGRQTVEAVVDELPVDRVLEVHLADGFERSGFWIDAHSGLTSARLLDIAERVLPLLPNLALVTFEVGADYVRSAEISAAALARHLEGLRHLIGHRRCASHPRFRAAVAGADRRRPRCDLTSWRDDLTLLVNGRAVSDHEWAAVDGGVELYRQLVAVGRSSTVVSAAPLTSRYLMMLAGSSRLEQLVDGFRAATLPHVLPLDELRAFETWLREHPAGSPDEVLEVLAFERALLETANDGRQRTVSFTTDPLGLLGDVGAGRAPSIDAGRRTEYRLTIEPPASTSR
jgi:uncharacterized protein (UPF0276 family)